MSNSPLNSDIGNTMPIPPESASGNSLKQIFADACELPADQRTAFLDSACGNDPSLREQIDSLLIAHDNANQFLAGNVTPETNLNYAQGDRIDRYKLLQPIGEGGFGVVYMAEQEHPIRRRVALKIIKLGMDTRAVIARFEAERQALAMMDHPNIAKVFDAGATDTGRPYFVMELVNGIPLTSYCDENRFTTSERLELFIDVCKAVQHAHQKGIIHRDLKPSNVLVTLHDGKPVPKVIDFGIAKATQARLTEKTLFTEFRQMIGTPQYMSPEQAEMSGLDIDTRTDVYSLGVLLYELLTGTTPLDSVELRSKAYGEMQRMIRDVEPPKPSTRLSSLQTLQTVAAQRRTEPRQLTRSVQGELDWIVMKSLEKDRTRRYDSATGLATDIMHFLAEEPIEAGKPSAAYRFKKYLLRHRVQFAAAILVAASILFGLLAITFGLVRSIRSQHIIEEENRTIAQQRDRALRAETDAIEQRRAAGTALVDMYTNAGLSEENDATAVLWFASAAKMAGTDAHRRDLNLARVRNWDRLTARPLRVLPQDNGINTAIESLEFHPSGFYLMTVSRRHESTIWDLPLERHYKLPGNIDGNCALAWSPNGGELAIARNPTAGDGKVEIYSFPKGDLIESIVHSGVVRSMTYSATGQYLAIVGEQTRVWDCDSHHFASPVLTHSGMASNAAFNFESDLLATSSSDHLARVFKISGEKGSSEPIVPPVDHKVIHAPFFVDGGKGVIAWGSAGLTWYDSVTGAIRCTPEKGNDVTSAFAVSPAGDQFLVAVYGNINLWDVDTAKRRSIWLNGNISATNLAFSPDSTTAATSSPDLFVRFWTVKDGSPKKLVIPHQHAPGRLAYSVDGSMIATCEAGGLVRVWRIDNSDLAVQRIPIAAGASNSQVSVDGKYLIPNGFERFPQGLTETGVYDTSTGQRAGRALRPGGLIVGADIFPDRTEAAVSTSGGAITVYNWKTGNALYPAIACPQVLTIRYSPDGRFLAAAELSGHVQLIDPNHGMIIKTLDHDPGTITSGNRYVNNAVVRFSPDGRQLIAWRATPWLSVWDVTSDEFAKTQLHLPGLVADANFSTDGLSLAVAGEDGKACVYDTRSWNLAAGIISQPERLIRIHFDHSGNRLLTTSGDGTVRIWDWRTGKMLTAVMQHKNAAEDAAFIDDDKYIISCSDDQNGTIWDALDGRLVAKPPAHTLFMDIQISQAAHRAFLGNWATSIYSYDYEALLNPGTWNSDDVIRHGEILSGKRIHETGGLTNLTTQEWIANWKALRHAHPDYPDIGCWSAPVDVTVQQKISNLVEKDIDSLTGEEAMTVARWLADREKGAVGVGKLMEAARQRRYMQRYLACQSNGEANPSLIVDSSLPSNPPPIVPTAPPGNWKTIDLLPLIDPTQDSRHGEWKKVPEGLLAPNISHGSLCIPYAPESEYNLVVSFKKIDGVDSISQMFSCGTARGLFIFNGFGGNASGFDLVANEWGNNNSTTVYRRPIPVGSTHSTLICVRKGRISSYLDGRLVSYLDQPEQLSLHDSWNFEQGDKLGLCAYSSTLFTSIKLIEP